MRHYTVRGTGLDSLILSEGNDPPPPGPGAVLVETRAVSLNYRDLMVAEGRYGRPLQAPMIPASDAAGTVLAVGPGVTRLVPGDRVLNAPFRNWPAGPLRREYTSTFIGGGGVDGVLAERFLFPAGALVRVPAHLSYREASTLTIAGLTAWGALVTFGGIRAGDWVLAHGTGGVSIYAAQLAKVMGARVILSTASVDKAAQVRQRFGVDATIDYRNPDWPAEVQRITEGHGADIIIETAGGATLARSLDASAYAGRVAVIGLLEGSESPLNLIRVLSRQLRIGGIYMESALELEALARAMEASKLRPAVDCFFPFEKAREAYEHLRSQRHIGKVVIEVKG